MIEHNTLRELYVNERKSMQEIASHLNCSIHKVDYWLTKHKIPKRTRSEATYVKRNREGDPFFIKPDLTPDEKLLYGMGVGIYWGEGNKKNLHAVRVGNTDPYLLKTFVKFLIIICGVKPGKIRYGLQVFTDINETEALQFWQKHLHIRREQIMPTVNRIESGKIGTYKIKNLHGVLTVYVFNKKLRDWLVSQLVMPT